MSEALETDDGLLGELEESDDSLFQTQSVEEGVKTPVPTDPEWSDWVQGHFAPDEVNDKGQPFVAGLRRVGRLLLGAVLESRARVVETGYHQATVEYSLRLLVSRPEGAYDVCYGDCADVNEENTDREFWRFAVATAATRAEARCWRKALGLRKVAAEECTSMKVLQEPETIQDSQLVFIDTICSRHDISALDYINMGKVSYDSPRDVPYETAQKMLRKLSAYSKSPSTIPDSIRGYQKGWF